MAKKESNQAELTRMFEAGMKQGRKQLQRELIELLGLWDHFEPRDPSND